MVVMVPSGPTRRMLWLPLSAMKRLPALSTAIPVGLFSRAATAGPPSPLKPVSPVPATVVMVPEGSTRRIRSFRVSAINKFPVLSIARPDGACSRAWVAGPLSPTQRPDRIQ